MNVSLMVVLLKRLVKILSAPSRAHVLMVMFSTVTVPAVTILMNVPMTPLVMSMLIAVTFQAHSSVHVMGDTMGMESLAKMLTNVPRLTPVLLMPNATIPLVLLNALVWMVSDGVSFVITSTNVS